MNSERNSQASSDRTSSPSIQEPEDLAQSAIFSPGFNPFNSFFPPPLDLEAIIPFTTLTHSPPISLLDLEETMNLGTETNLKGKKVKLNLPKPFNGKCENLKMFLQDSQMYIFTISSLTRTILFLLFTIASWTTCYEHMFIYVYFLPCITCMLHASDACLSFLMLHIIPLLLYQTHVEHVSTMR